LQKACFIRARPVVLKVVDIDPQGSVGPFKGSINSYGFPMGITEWPGGQWITAGVYWSNEVSISKLLIEQGMQTAFFSKSNKIKRADQDSAKVV